MKKPLFDVNAITEEHPFPGTGDFRRIDRIIFGAGPECMAITPAATIGKKLPLVSNSCHHTFFFPDDHNPAEYIHGKLHKNGILLLKFTFKDGTTREVSTTPPYTVYWATSDETPKGASRNIVRGKA